MAKRRGRPSVGERVPLGLRVTPEMKRRLDEAAKRSGRSQSQEAEFRLERSFDRSDLLSDVLRLEFGRDLAGVLMMLGSAMIWADAFHRVDSPADKRPRANHPWRWAPDLQAYNEAVDAAVTILQALRPLGQAGPRTGSGVDVANHLLKAVRDNTGTGLTENIDQIRSLLGPLIKRIDPAISGRLNEGRPNQDE
jgi:TraY domain